jgi:MarR family transcriptional regulator, organic hydroperoxide resistance regulator
MDASSALPAPGRNFPRAAGVRRRASSTRGPIIAGIVQELQEILQEIDRYSRKSLRRFGVTGPQVWALRVIRRAGKITTGDLADRMYLHISTISSLIDRLERRHLVERTTDRADRRKVWLSLTSKGRWTAGTTPPSPRSRLPGGLERCSLSDLQELQRSLGLLGSILLGREPRSAARARSRGND